LTVPRQRSGLGRYWLSGSGGVTGRFPIPLAPDLPFRYRPAPAKLRPNPVGRVCAHGCRSDVRRRSSKAVVRGRGTKWLGRVVSGCFGFRHLLRNSRDTLQNHGTKNNALFRCTIRLNPRGAHGFGSATLQFPAINCVGHNDGITAGAAMRIAACRLPGHGVVERCYPAGGRCGSADPRRRGPYRPPSG
jgi:hypothetical protein